MEKYIREGAAAYYSQQGGYKNPYQHGSEEFNAFERGWMQSLKKDDAQLVSRAKSHSASPRKAYSSNEDAAKTYKSRKG
ncbi:hypothetical protein I5R65_06015 [Herbaspirillum sp. AP02]|uniref:hypothetical protein n=1 Tax=unclassified Herbaspirillum TaxID=2624150 RepID=UPI0015DAF9A8|nr:MULTISPECIES: hypothetical protein [unclassified Herbaspirillum]MBG7619012.1 hypothetical protein [Herbaspirillum sp. AP02]NZD66297.1 hypothetical protein [Herbaspirillum sp. AP21]